MRGNRLSHFAVWLENLQILNYNEDTILSADAVTPELTVRKHEEWLCDQTEREYGI